MVDSVSYSKLEIALVIFPTSSYSTAGFCLLGVTENEDPGGELRPFFFFLLFTFYEVYVIQTRDLGRLIDEVDLESIIAWLWNNTGQPIEFEFHCTGLGKYQHLLGKHSLHSSLSTPFFTGSVVSLMW